MVTALAVWNLVCASGHVRSGEVMVPPDVSRMTMTTEIVSKEELPGTEAEEMTALLLPRRL